jgi:glycosyltransferase involved in cell wall biosynthesis
MFQPVLAVSQPRPAPGRALHVVQVSLDADLLDERRGREPRARQRAYADELVRQRPGSTLTVLVLSARPGAGRYTDGPLHVVPVGGPWRGCPALFAALSALHRRLPIDVVTTQRVHAEAWVVLLFARLHSVRVVGQLHDDPFAPEPTAGLRSRMRRLARRASWRTLRYFVALRTVGHGVKQRLLAERLHARVEVVPVPVAHLEDVATRSPVVRERTPTVLFVGRLCAVKNPSTWLEVASRVAQATPDARFLVIGDGPERAALERRAAELGIAERVRFAGYVPSARLGEHYAAASVLLLTSVSEGFGRVAAEAHAFATPVVATRVTGLQDIVADGESGFLCAQGDVDGLAAAVLRLLREPDLRRRMGEIGRARVRERFAPAALRERWIGLLVAAAREDLAPLVLPRRRTPARWARLAASPHSLLRSLQYEAIEGLGLRGRTLDLGGGARSSYRPLLRVAGEIESVNIDPEIEPSYVLDLNQHLTLRDATFDNVISLNTFEHLRRDTVALAEAIRVLKPGGSFHFLIPWLYRVHGSPHDFHRHTWLWWREQLEALGVAREDLRIEPLVWSRLATAASFFGATRPGRLLRALLLLPAVLRDLVRDGERLPDGGPSRRLCDYALGYYVHGRK